MHVATEMEERNERLAFPSRSFAAVSFSLTSAAILSSVIPAS